MYTNVTTISNEICRREWSQILPKVKITSNHLCTIAPVGVGACQGDSGSALAADGKLIGIISFGLPCAWGKPDVFEKVLFYKRWIKKIVEKQ